MPAASLRPAYGGEVIRRRGIDPDGPITWRLSGLAKFGWLVVVAPASVALWIAASQAQDPESLLWLAFGGALTAATSIQALRIRLTVTADGISAQNWTTRHEWAWVDIVRITEGSAGVLLSRMNHPVLMIEGPPGVIVRLEATVDLGRIEIDQVLTLMDRRAGGLIDRIDIDPDTTRFR